MTKLAPSQLIVGLGLLAAVLAGVSLVTGPADIPFAAWFAADDDPRRIIILELRIPRTALGLLIGAALGMAGAALQGYTRNPLADPAILGVSSMAALGAVLTFYLGAVGAAAWSAPAGAMVGALVGVGALILLAGASTGLVTFVLAGVVLNIVAGAGMSLALSLAPDPWAVAEIVNWLFGALTDRSLGDLGMAAPFIVVGCGLMLATGRALDAMTLGPVAAASLGIDLARVRLILALGVGLAAGASVAAAGVVGFVGLVTPHLLRPLAGNRPAALLIPSALGGACVLLAADIAVRLIPAATELKLGIATAVLGGPFFLIVLLKTRRRLG